MYYSQALVQAACVYIRVYPRMLIDHAYRTRRQRWLDIALFRFTLIDFRILKLSTNTHSHRSWKLPRSCTIIIMMNIWWWSLNIISVSSSHSIFPLSSKSSWFYEFYFLVIRNSWSLYCPWISILDTHAAIMYRHCSQLYNAFLTSSAFGMQCETYWFWTFEENICRWRRSNEECENVRKMTTHIWDATK